MGVNPIPDNTPPYVRSSRMRGPILAVPCRPLPPSGGEGWDGGESYPRQHSPVRVSSRMRGPIPAVPCRPLPPSRGKVGMGVNPIPDNTPPYVLAHAGTHPRCPL